MTVGELRKFLNSYSEDMPMISDVPGGALGIEIRADMVTGSLIVSLAPKKQSLLIPSKSPWETNQ